MTDVRTRLEEHDGAAIVTKHRFFDLLQSQEISLVHVGAFMSQYWHPLHYFPTFLSRLISVTPSNAMQTVISRILWQELGEGDPARSHEAIYVTTMADGGLDGEALVSTAPNARTAELVDFYASSSHDYYEGLGALYGTEVIDLSIVSGLGGIVGKVTKQALLPWVDIHVLQEPDHVETADVALQVACSEEQEAVIVRSAERMWRLWADFFSELESVAA